MAQELYVITRGSDAPPTAVRYNPDMLFCTYLRHVLAPAFNSPMLHHGCTVAERFGYVSDDGCIQVFFNRERRMERVGNFIPAGATLERIPDRGGSTSLHGNAVEGDITQPCVICQGTEEGYCCFGLEGCPHRFHAKCMLDFINQRAQERCPVCRRDFTPWDRTVIWMIKQVQRPW
jgi:hypothetical protein